MIAGSGRVHVWDPVCSKRREFSDCLCSMNHINTLNLERITKVSPKTLPQFIAKILLREMD